MQEFEFRITITTDGDFTEDDLRDFVRFLLGYGTTRSNNPFIVGDADITDMDITTN